MQRRYISDTGYAVILIAIGICAHIAVFVYGAKDILATGAGNFFLALGVGLMSVVRERKRRGLDAQKETPTGQSAKDPE